MPQFPAVSIGDAASLRDVGTLHSQLKPLSEAVELLTGQRTRGVRAVMSDSIGVDPTGKWMAGTQIHAPSGAVTTAAGGVPTYNDYILTVQDLYQLREDVITIQTVLRDLVKNLKA